MSDTTNDDDDAAKTLPGTPRAKTHVTRRKRSTLTPGQRKAAAPVLVTLGFALMTSFFEYRTQAIRSKAESVSKETAVVSDRTDKGYETLAPLVTDLQQQVKVLAAQVDLLRQVTVAQAHLATKTTRFSAPVADAILPKVQLEQLENAPNMAAGAAAAAPPATLDQAAASP